MPAKKKPATRKSAEKTSRKQSKPEELPVAIVGIGASAGGLEAFSQLLQNLPADTGMAFVLVQHMDPNHESMLKDLLVPKTKIPVLEVKDGMEPKANHVYVIPPNAAMTLDGNKLRLAPRAREKRPHMPIDLFFQSLAKNRNSRAIGVILSGTATDGTLGLKAIKAEGGLTFAQDEGSAKWYGMPSSAVAAGCVDAVLPPERIAKELPRVMEHPYVKSVPTMEELQQPLDGDLQRICSIVRRVTGVNFTTYKPSTIRRRINRRMALHRIDSVRRYVEYLEGDREEVKRLYEDILIHVTSFFREPELFRALEKEVFPEIVEGRSRDDAIRIWAPGCSTGEEVYSIAITLVEYLSKKRLTIPFQIFGTDISDQSIEAARSAVYLECALADLSAEQRRRFFQRHDGKYQVIKSIREGCIFARHDLGKDPPFSRLDLISCRNVLIYLGAELQKRVITVFHYALKPNGFLVLGKSENLSGHSNLFAIRNKKHRIFTRKQVATPGIPHLHDMAGGVHEPAGKPVEEAAAPERETDLTREIDRILWRRYKGAGLVLDGEMQIVHFRGAVARFLSPSSGEASFDVNKMVRNELLVDLRAAVQKAKKENQPVRREGIRLRFNGRPLVVNLEVVPLRRRDSKQPHFAVLFEEAGEQPPAEQPKPARKDREPRDRKADEVEQLQRELDYTREHLQTATEEYERTMEELRAANEEILSSNEELQSANEEIETAKEELQSANEELTTVNEEQQNRNSELAALADDLNNLINGINVPIVFLGPDLRIRRFTPKARDVFHLIAGDVGRPISDIRSKIEIADWERMISEVFENIRMVEREIEDRDNRWWNVQLRPYKTAENRIDGVLMILTDITDKKKTEKSLEDRIRLLADTGRDMVCLHDLEGRCTYVSPSCHVLLGFAPEELTGRKLWEVAHPENRERLWHDHYERVAEGEFVPPAVYRIAKKSGQYVWFETVTQPVFEGSKILNLRSVSRDVTERVEAKGLAAQRQEEIQTLMQALLRSQEEERKRIALELHDDVAQRLAYISMQAETLLQKPDISQDAQKSLEKIRDDLGSVADSLRQTAHQLHPSAIEHLGLRAGLGALCEEISLHSRLKVRFQARNAPEKAPLDVGLCLYRVLQEALRNVAKHSGADKAEVRLTGVKGGVRMTIRDGGNGFDPKALRGRKGLGLISMKERVELLGGKFQLETRPGGGVRIQVDIPLP